MIPESVLIVLELIGTIAFAVSGALVAINAKFDIFGVLVIGCITAIGGGITRDLLIGVTPPVIFSRAYIIAVAALTALTVFIVAYFYRNRFHAIREKIETINNIFDALGLAVFTVTGMEIAFANGLSDNVFLSVTLGVLTGVGGGVLRDILTETPPYIFKKHVYALASISGAAVYYLLRRFVDIQILPSVVAMLFIFTLRLLATKYRWKLPKVIVKDESEKKGN